MTSTPSSPKLPEPLKVVAWLTSWPKDRARPAGSIVNRSEPQQKFDYNQYDPLVRLSDAQASIQALEADAARYRWLREQNWFSGPLCVLSDPKRVLTRGIGLGADCPFGSRLDAAIDAARAAQEVKP